MSDLFFGLVMFMFCADVDGVWLCESSGWVLCGDEGHVPCMGLFVENGGCKPRHLFDESRGVCWPSYDTSVFSGRVGCGSWAL